MIVIAYDGSLDAGAAIDQAGKLFPGAQATVLAVWVPFIETMARTGIGLAPGTVSFEEIDAASAQAASERAAEGAERARAAGLDAEPRTCSQRLTIAGSILSEARELGADAIVVGTRGLTGIKSLLLGSVSHAVIQHADRPVIVVPSSETAAARAAREP